jgi:hypothetical protein
MFVSVCLPVCVCVCVFGSSNWYSYKPLKAGFTSTKMGLGTCEKARLIHVCMFVSVCLSVCLCVCVCLVVVIGYKPLKAGFTSTKMGLGTCEKARLIHVCIKANLGSTEACKTSDASRRTVTATCKIIANLTSH